MGVTGDPVAISGTGVRHVSLKSNVHPTPLVKGTEVQLVEIDKCECSCSQNWHVVLLQ